MKLVIVESPAKCTTIQKYLGDGYLVKASLGHVRDLATRGKGGLGVDVEHGFEPTYEIYKDKYKVTNELKALSKKADEVILATDPDREGEAIAWHLCAVLGLNPDTNKRLEFHEITRDSINAAIENPRTIDMNLVSSQETRRILDRIIGFKLSTLVKSKIRSQSAGRVQSATLKLIDEHDDEIKHFISEEYWNIIVNIAIHGKEYKLDYLGFEGKNGDVHNKKESDTILAQLPDNLKIISAEKSFKTVETKDPLTTSTMQQEAFAKLKFKTKKTQFIAQGLYEGLSINDEHVGLITYMRTDSPRLSPIFVAQASAFIKDTYGEEYLAGQKQIKKVGHVQDAHEAIRPTSITRTPDSIRKYLTPDQYNLYKLIYNRAIASLFKGRKEEVTKIIFDGNGHRFALEFTRVIFPGFDVVFKEKENTVYIPDVNVNDEFAIISKTGEQKFTQPPAPYSEAKLVKLMEEVGIGRPSTYASTIDTLKKRGYINNASGILTCTEQGNKTVAVLRKYFPEIVDTKYTANMETDLDKVQAGENSRNAILSRFYGPFCDRLSYAKEHIYQDEQVETGEKCPICGAPLVEKEGKNGKFIGCSNYPKCKYVKKEPKPEPKYTGENCPVCGAPLVERIDRTGKKFVACSAYPKCKYTVQDKQEITPEKYVKKCPKCGGYLIEKKGKYSKFLGCTNYPTCNYMEKISKKKK